MIIFSVVFGLNFRGRVSEIFNDHYINIIENITGEKQEELHSDSLRNKNQTGKEEILSGILEK